MHLEDPAVAGPVDVLRALVREGGLRTVFQPIVELATQRVVGVEALTRGPAGTDLERPDLLFALAREHGLGAALDRACRLTALRRVLADGLQGPVALFLNAEPEGLGDAVDVELEVLAAEVRARGVRVVLEITERDLTARPAQLLAAVGRARALGWAVAVDDVGAERASLALMPFLEPDVVKLDLRLVQQRTTVEVAEIVNAVLAQAERTGAVVLAEGIETPGHAALAASMGATLGQGWLFGRPGALPLTGLAGLPLPDRRLDLDARTPWERVGGVLPVRRATKPLLVAMSKTLERQAGVDGEAAVVLGTFQHARHVTVDTRARYEGLAASAAFVAAFGVGLGDEQVGGVHLCSFTPGDPLELEWDLAVVGPHFAAALVARDLGDDGDQSERRFDYTLTYDRGRVLDVARALLGRVPPHRTTLAARVPRQSLRVAS